MNELVRGQITEVLRDKALTEKERERRVDAIVQSLSKSEFWSMIWSFPLLAQSGETDVSKNVGS